MRGERRRHAIGEKKGEKERKTKRCEVRRRGEIYKAVLLTYYFLLSSFTRNVRRFPPAI